VADHLKEPVKLQRLSHGGDCYVFGDKDVEPAPVIGTTAAYLGLADVGAADHAHAAAHAPSLNFHG